MLVNKNGYINIVNDKISNKNSKKLILRVIDKYYYIKNNYICSNNCYNIGAKVILKKGSLLYGTYKNIDGLKSILES